MDTNADDGEEIAADFLSKEYMLVYPERTNVSFIDCFAINRGNTKAWVDLDREDKYKELGGLTQRITNFQIQLRECNSLRIKFADNSTETSVVEGFNVQHKPKDKRKRTVKKIRGKNDG